MMPVVLWLILQGQFESPREAFRRAEALYQEQRYDEAVEVYEAMRAQGIEDGALYYNLGNAYFKAGRLGRAVLNYERARELMPGDPDVRANLAFASELVAESVEPPPLPLIIRWAVDWYERLRPSTLARILSLSFLVGGAAVTLLLSQRFSGLHMPMLLALGVSVAAALAAGASLLAKLDAEATRDDAIVLTENAYVRSGPGEASPRLAEIHEGLKVRVLSEREAWFQVELANGLNGWIPSEQVERIRIPE
ncbi:MAG TPA: tetratricopeptide repeat protein [Vicinamibacteria bacterium]|nr:tetratricopeptide repeat protein [Vicinamibacteria bacterium]